MINVLLFFAVAVAVAMMAILVYLLCFLWRDVNSTVHQTPGFEFGDIVHLKINPAVSGMIKDSVGCSPHFSEPWGYNVRLPDGTMLNNVREYEIERD